MTNTEIATAFFDALAKEDEVALRALCAASFKPQQNGGPALSIEALLGFATAIHGVVQDFAYGDPVRSETATGFVQEYRLRGKLQDGTAVDLPVCVVGDVTGGKSQRHASISTAQQPQTCLRRCGDGVQQFGCLTLARAACLAAFTCPRCWRSVAVGSVHDRRTAAHLANRAVSLIDALPPRVRV